MNNLKKEFENLKMNSFTISKDRNKLTFSRNGDEFYLVSSGKFLFSNCDELDSLIENLLNLKG